MGVQRNFMFSAILTVSNYIFPFLVYPYVARVLGVENIGICNFVDSIINYGMLVSLMGITMIGTREIAKAQGDKEQLNRAFTSLFVISLVTTVIATVALITLTYTLHAFAPYRKLLLIGLVKLWGNFFLIEWFYKGIEDFRYITLRTIAVKLGFVVSVFLLIRTASDYTVYFLLLCLMVAINAVINCARAARIVDFRLDRRMMRGMLLPFFVLGCYLLLNSMYTTFNVTWLGLKCGDTEVGYYTTSTKIFQIILAIYSAYSSVILPRASALLSSGNKEEFRQLINTSIDGLMMFAIPIISFIMIFSDGVVGLIAGSGYEGAIVPMMIVMPLVFIIGYEQILVIQILTPMARDRSVFFNSIVGATVGVVANLLIVKAYAAIGSAVVWVIAEIAVLICAQTFVTRYTGLRFPLGRLLRNIAAYLPYVAVCIAVALIAPGPIVAMIIGGVILPFYFVGVQRLVLHNSLYCSLAEAIGTRIRPRKGVSDEI